MTKSSNTFVIVTTIGILALIGIFFIIGMSSLGRDDGGSDDPDVSAESLIGGQAPFFALTDLQGGVYTNESLRGKKVVLFFNEGLRCYPACWNAMTALGSDPRLDSDDIAVFSVVVDSPGEWKRAMNKVPELENANVLFDENGAVSRAFGMLTLPSSMHYGSLPGHTYVILDGYGTIRSVMDDPRMGVLNDDLVLELSALDGELIL